MKQPIITNELLNKIDRYEKSKYPSNMHPPYLNVRMQGNYGQAQLIQSLKCDAPVTLLSRLEKKIFFHLERNSQIQKIYTQWPLDINKTLSIANRLEIMHPRSIQLKKIHHKGVPAIVMTTDIVSVITDSSGQSNLLATSVKYSDEYKNSSSKGKRTQQKLLIERTYWERQGYKYQILDENCISDQAAMNLAFLRNILLHNTFTKMDIGLVTIIKNYVEQLRNKNIVKTYNDHIIAISELTNEPLEKIDLYIKYLIYDDQIPISLEYPINPSQPLMYY